MDWTAKALAALSALLLLAATVELSRDWVVRAYLWLKVLADRLAGSFRRLLRGEALGSHDRLAVSCTSGSFAFAYATYTIDPVAGVLLMLVSPWITLRAARWRRQVRERRIEGEIPDLSRALADMVSSGYSLRGAMSEIAKGWSGPMKSDLHQVRLQLELGVSTVVALERFGNSTESRLLDMFVSALLLQRQVGGDLPSLLRDIAKNAEEQGILAAEARAATAQARFTATLVLLMPLAGVALAELASPGFLAAAFSSFLAIWVIGLSLVFQAVGFFLIRRLAKAPMRWL